MFVFKGTEFERLVEARWCVFLDALGWSYMIGSGEAMMGKRKAPSIAAIASGLIYFDVFDASVGRRERQRAVVDWCEWSVAQVQPRTQFVLVFGDPWISMEAYVMGRAGTDDIPSLFSRVLIGQCPCCKTPSLLSVGAEIKQRIWGSAGFNRQPYEMAIQFGDAAGERV